MEVNKIYNENCLDTMKRMPDNWQMTTLFHGQMKMIWYMTHLWEVAQLLKWLG